MDPGKERAERILVGAIVIDGRREWICKFCSEFNVWTKWRCWRCHNNIPAGLHGKYKQAVAAKTGDWSTGRSSSSGEEDKRSRSQEAEIKELPEHVEWFRKQRGEAGQEGESGPSRRESGLEEDWGMEVEEKLENGESKRKLDEQRNRPQKELRDIEKLSLIPQEIQSALPQRSPCLVNAMSLCLPCPLAAEESVVHGRFIDTCECRFGW